MPRRALLVLLVIAPGCEPTMPLPGPPPAPPGAPATPAPRDDDAPRFGIGGGEDAAHGGVQDVDGPDGTRTRQVNWGGLVDRGGGTADYDELDDVADLARIQNPPPGQHVGPYPWQPGVAYEYRVERGARVTLPPGDYQLIPDRPVVRVPQARTMWEWRFTVRPLAGDGPAYAAVLYDNADTFTSFYLWNESGYGSTDAAQHTTWSAPRYLQAGHTDARAPARWQRF